MNTLPIILLQIGTDENRDSPVFWGKNAVFKMDLTGSQEELN
jgi:hypothetical protein